MDDGGALVAGSFRLHQGHTELQPLLESDMPKAWCQATWHFLGDASYSCIEKELLECSAAAHKVIQSCSHWWC